MMKENFQICPVVKKYLILLPVSFCINGTILSQVGNVGINTTAPAAMLHVKDSSVVFTGISPLPVSPGSPSVSGAGTRMMWYPDKAAFRVGGVSGSQWDKANIGSYSIAMGNATRASGLMSTALGNGATASGVTSTAIGDGTMASGGFSTAMGFSTTASGLTATATGSLTTASGWRSTSMGYSTKAKSFASLVMGQYNDTTSLSSSDWNPLDPLFIIGNGSASNARSNAMTVLKNGKTGINTHDPKAMLHVKDSSVVFSGSFSLPAPTGNPPVSGSGIRMMWYADKAAFRAGRVAGTSWNRDSIGFHSVAFGSNTKAKGDNSMAVGQSTSAIGNYSVAMGSNTNAGNIFSTAMGSSTIASGSTSTAMGRQTVASGNYSTTMGDETTASGSHSTAMGEGTIASGDHATSMGRNTKAIGDISNTFGSNTTAKAFASFVIGQYNDTTANNSGFWYVNDPVFIIGNGSSNGALSNAMTVLKNGKTGIGTTAPERLLHVQSGSSGATSNSAAVAVFERNGDAAINLLTPNVDASAVYFGNVSHTAHGGIVYNSTTPNGFQFRVNGNSTKMVIADDGNVGIGTIAPTEKLHVVGDICYTGSIAACSDIRYKKNILPISNALSSLQCINGIYYNWDKIKFPDNEFNDERQIGFSAQELESIIPEVVHTDPNGFKSVDYSRLTPVLVEAIKEQQNMISSQQASLDSQQVKLESQQTQLNLQQVKLESLEKELQEMRSMLSGQY